MCGASRRSRRRHPIGLRARKLPSRARATHRHQIWPPVCLRGSRASKKGVLTAILGRGAHDGAAGLDGRCRRARGDLLGGSIGGRGGGEAEEREEVRGGVAVRFFCLNRRLFPHPMGGGNAARAAATPSATHHDGPRSKGGAADERRGGGDAGGRRHRRVRDDRGRGARAALHRDAAGGGGLKGSHDAWVSGGLTLVPRPEERWKQNWDVRSSADEGPSAAFVAAATGGSRPVSLLPMSLSRRWRASACVKLHENN